MICVKKSAAGSTLKKSKNLNFLFGEGWVGSQRCLRGRVMNVWRHVESVGWTNRDSWLWVKKSTLLEPCNETEHGPGATSRLIPWNSPMAHSSRVHDSCIFMVNGQRYSPSSEGLPDHIHPRMCWDCPCHLGCACDATMTGPVEVIIIIVQSCHHHQRREPGEVVKKKLGKLRERLKESFFVTILLPIFSAVTAVVISY